MRTSPAWDRIPPADVLVVGQHAVRRDMLGEFIAEVPLQAPVVFITSLRRMEGHWVAQPCRRSKRPSSPILR
jgi:hypothetical protein